MPIRGTKKKTATAASDALLVGEVPEAIDPGLASLLEDPIDTGRGSNLPRVESRPPFLYRHWPMSWEIGEIDGSPAWLPRIEPHLLVKGADGIRTPGPHEPESAAYSDSVLKARRKGWVYLPLSTIIPTELLPPGVAAGRYRRRIRGVHPVTRVETEAWVSAWAVPQSGLPDSPITFELHRESWDRWRASLVKSGTIAAPVAQARNHMRATIERHLGRTRNSSISPDVRAAKIADLERRIKELESAEVPA